MPCENLHCNTLVICLSLCESVYGRFSTVYMWLKLLCLVSKYCLNRVLYQDQRTACCCCRCFSYLRGAEISDPGPLNLKTHILHHAFMCPLSKEMSVVDVTVWPVFLASAEASSLNASHHALLMGEAGAPWSTSFCRWRSCRAAELPSLKGRMLFLKTFF